MTVEAADVNAMKDILARFNSFDLGSDESVSTPTISHSVEAGNSEAANTAAMKSILESFYAVADDTVNEIVETIPHSPKLAEAIQTSRVAGGAKIGSWVVRSYTGGPEGQDTFFDITNPETNEILFEDFVIFEAAHAIVRYLNKGLNETHAKIIEILDFEENYRRNRQDAAVFKRRYTKCKENKELSAAEVFKSRFQKAKAQAVAAKDHLQSILDNIR